MEDKKRLHSGHRKRMRERVLSTGMDSLAPHEVLEVLLYQVIPYKDTNETAHELLEKYESLAGVLNAPIEELVKFKNIGESAAISLKMFPELSRAYQQDLHKSSFKLNNAREIADFFRPLLSDCVVEEVYVVCTNAKKEYINKKLMRSGGPASVDVSVREIVQFALSNRASGVILAHSHPGGVAEPSAADINFTRVLHDALMALDIALMEHIIIAGQTSHSFFKDGEIAKFRAAYETRVKHALSQKGEELKDE